VGHCSLCGRGKRVLPDVLCFKYIRIAAVVEQVRHICTLGEWLFGAFLFYSLAYLKPKDYICNVNLIMGRINDGYKQHNDRHLLLRDTQGGHIFVEVARKAYGMDRTYNSTTAHSLRTST
jgi:hypothetical protein